MCSCLSEGNTNTNGLECLAFLFAFDYKNNKVMCFAEIFVNLKFRLNKLINNFLFVSVLPEYQR